MFIFFQIYGYSSGDVFAKKSKETERSSIVEASEDSCAEMATYSNGSVWSGKDMVRIFNLMFNIYKLKEVA